MASSVSLYTLGNMSNATCIFAGDTGGTPESGAGFPKENIMDFNPDTYYKVQSAALREIKIDLATSKTVNACIIWIKNYLLNTSGDLYEIFSSPDDSVYTSRGTGNLADITPITIEEITQQTDRYWRLRVDAAVDPYWISGIWLCRKWTISQGNEWPEQDTEVWHNRSFQTYGGRSFVQAINQNKVDSFSRTYQLNESQMNILKSAFTDCGGSRFPLVLQEGSTNFTAQYCRFAQDELNENQIDYQLYRPTVNFLTVPYIADGGNF